MVATRLDAGRICACKVSVARVASCFDEIRSMLMKARNFAFEPLQPVVRECLIDVLNERLVGARWCWHYFARIVSMRTAEDRDAVEYVLLEPFHPKINDGRDKQGDQLGEDKTADNHQP